MRKKLMLPGWLIPSGIALLAVLLVLGVWSGVRAITRRNNMRVGQTVSINADAQPEPFGSDYLYTANMTIYCVSPTGETRWTLPLRRENAPFDVMGDSLCIAESDALYVYHRDDDGMVQESFHKDLQGLQMNDVVCGRSHMALLTENRDLIYVLGQDGSQIENIDLTGQTIVDVGFYTQNDLMWVVALDTRGSAPLTNVRIYELGKSTIAMQSFSDELISTMVIDNNNGVALTIGTQYISAIDIQGGTGISTGQATSIFGYQYVCDNGQNDRRIVLAPASQLVRQSVIDLAVYHNGALETFSLPTECHAFLATAKYLYAANASTAYRMTYSGQVLEQIDMSGLYDRAAAVGTNSLFFFGNNSAAIVTVK